MFTRQSISIGNLLLNINNFRIVAQESQKGVIDAIIAEQGKKLVVLATDIVENGVSPFDLFMVVDAEDGNSNFIMMEGNRRLSTRLSHVMKDVKASKLMTDKELKPINVAISNKNDLLAPETLNAYVHSALMNPDPQQLKLMWSNVQLFLERLWEVK